MIQIYPSVPPFSVSNLHPENTCKTFITKKNSSEEVILDLNQTRTFSFWKYLNKIMKSVCACVCIRTYVQESWDIQKVQLALLIF